MEGMGWIKYLMKCFCGWYPWMRMWGDEKGRKENERRRGEGGIYTLGRHVTWKLEGVTWVRDEGVLQVTPHYATSPLQLSAL